MSELTIYGASDDVVVFDGAITAERDACSSWSGDLVAPNGDSLTIRAEFSKPGSAADWTLEVQNTGTWPSWPIRFANRPDREGDPALIIDVPDGTIIKETAKA